MSEQKKNPDEYVVFSKEAEQQERTREAISEGVGGVAGDAAYGVEEKSESFWREKQDRNRVVERYLPLVRKVLSRLSYRFPPLMEEGDMVAVGVMGLMDAVERYTPGALAFSQYAEIRIRGAILDELRRSDPFSRSQRRKSRIFQRAEQALRVRLGRHPQVEELAEHMKLSVAEVETLREELQPTVFVEVDALDGGSEERVGVVGSFSSRSRHDPQRRTQVEQAKQRVREGLEKLPERQRLILYLYYFEEMTLREIGERFALSESRICQIHQKACQTLRLHLPDDMGIFG
jgi:RNA polymerase sigma factor for flagellar operon FliA